MSLKVVVIGANGFLGRALASRLKQLTHLHVDPDKELPIREIVLFSLHMAHYENDPEVRANPRISLVQGDLCDAQATRKAVSPAHPDERVVVFLLAAVLSGNAETNFDLGLKVNLHGSLALLETMRAVGRDLARPLTLVYTSSDYVACFNDANRRTAFSEEGFRLSPASYGVQKACMELLVSDFSRRGFVDGRVGRISAMIGRPGFSNSVSSAFSMIFTQTLQGNDYKLPLPMDAVLPCSSLENNVECLLLLGGRVSGDAIGHNRVVQLPAASYTLADIWASTREVAARHGIKLGAVVPVAATEASTTFTQINVVPRVDCAKAVRLGLPQEIGLPTIIRNFLLREGLVRE